MKTAFSNVACMELPWREVLRLAADNGLDAVEIRMDEKDRLFGLEEGDLDLMTDSFRKKGIVISDIGSGVCVSGMDEKLLERAEKDVCLAARVGAKGMRVFLGHFLKRFSEQAPCDDEGICRFLGLLCDFAYEKKIEIWIETHNEYSTGTVLKSLLDRVGKDNLNVIWDVIHPIEAGEDPSDTLKALGSRIVHVHLKDGLRPRDPDIIDYTYTALGKGNVPLKRILSLLEGADYNGYCSLEWEKVWRPEIRDLYPKPDALLKDFTEWYKKVLSA